ncbi:hypothetical protein C0V77_20230 [Emticicia sp. TH156]|nr:hypothetical protein C0V77_20230 [Emticicia sp. TH156]
MPLLLIEFLTLYLTEFSSIKDFSQDNALIPPEISNKFWINFPLFIELKFKSQAINIYEFIKNTLVRLAYYVLQVQRVEILTVKILVLIRQNIYQ